MPSSDLFDLIHALSGPEKRYFRLFAQRHAGEQVPNYVRLFDAIENQEVYDEDALRKTFAGEKFIAHLPSEKRYLRTQILRAMRAYEDQRSPERELYEWLQDQHFLYQRGLYRQSGQLLEKIRKRAAELENWPVLMETLQRSLDLTVEQEQKHLRERWMDIQKALRGALEKLEEETGFKEGYFETFIAYRMEADTRNQASTEATVSDLIPGSQAASTFMGQTYLLMTKAILCRQSGDLDFFFDHLATLKKLWDDHPEKASFYPAQYLKILSNYLNACYKLHRFEDFPGTLAHIRSLPAPHWDFEAEVFQNSCHLELLFYLNTADFERGKALVPVIEAGLERYAGKINKAREFSFFYNLMILFFFMEDYQAAGVWLERIMIDKNHGIRQDIQYTSRILQMVFHYERDNLLILESLYRSAYRYLKKRDQLSETESALLRFFRRLPDIQDDQGKAAFLNALLAELATIAESPGFRRMPGFNEILLWARSKREGNAIREVYKATLKAQQENASAPG